MVRTPRAVREMAPGRPRTPVEAQEASQNASQSRRNFPVFLQEHGGSSGGFVQLRAAEKCAESKRHQDRNIVAIDDGLCFARFKTYLHNSIRDLLTGELCCFIDRGLHFMRRYRTLGRDVNPEDIATFGARKKDGGCLEERPCIFS